MSSVLTSQGGYFFTVTPLHCICLCCLIGLLASMKNAQIRSPQWHGIKPANYRPNLQQHLLFHIWNIMCCNQSGTISRIWFIGKGIDYCWEGGSGQHYQNAVGFFARSQHPKASPGFCSITGVKLCSWRPHQPPSHWVYVFALKSSSFLTECLQHGHFQLPLPLNTSGNSFVVLSAYKIMQVLWGKMHTIQKCIRKLSKS